MVENWSTPKGGLIVFNYGDSEAIGTSDAIAEVMFKEFYDLRHYWTDNHRHAIAQVEQRHARGYADHPVMPGEFDLGETEQPWGEQ